MRIAVNGNRLVATGDVSVIAEHAAGAAAAGLDGYWLAQHPAGALDALTTLAIIGRSVPGLALGTGVVPVWGRHPAALAAQALTAAQAIPGSLTVGIGLSHPAMVEQHLGQTLYARPTTTMREYLEVLVPLITDGRASHRGDIYQYENRVAVVAEPRPTVLVAAMGEQMLRLAGRLAHGTIVSWTGPVTLRDHVIPTITQAAGDAGRPSPRIGAVFSVCVTDEVELARDAVREWFEIHGRAPSYEAMIEREGVSSASDIAIIGSEEEVRSRIETLAALGVTELVVGEVMPPGDGDGGRTRALLAELARSGALAS